MSQNNIDNLIAGLKNKGKGCKCSAYYVGECACGVSWPEHHIDDAIKQLEFLKKLSELCSESKHSNEFVGILVRDHLT